MTYQFPQTIRYPRVDDLLDLAYFDTLLQDMPVVPPAQEVDGDLAFKGVLSPELDSSPSADPDDAAPSTTEATSTQIPLCIWLGPLPRKTRVLATSVVYLHVDPRRLPYQLTVVDNQDYSNHSAHHSLPQMSQNYFPQRFLSGLLFFKISTGFCQAVLISVIYIDHFFRQLDLP